MKQFQFSHVFIHQHMKFISLKMFFIHLNKNSNQQNHQPQASLFSQKLKIYFPIQQINDIFS